MSRTVQLWGDAQSRFLETSARSSVDPPPVLCLLMLVLFLRVCFNQFALHTFRFGRKDVDIWLRSTISFQNTHLVAFLGYPRKSSQAALSTSIYSSSLRHKSPEPCVNACPFHSELMVLTGDGLKSSLHSGSSLMHFSADQLFTKSLKVHRGLPLTPTTPETEAL